MMRRTEVRDMTDDYDRDIAQIVHRVGIQRVVLELSGGGYIAFEPVEDPNQHLYEDLSCPDCGKAVNWDEESQDYVHQSTTKAKGCWLNRNNARD